MMSAARPAYTTRAVQLIGPSHSTGRSTCLRLDGHADNRVTHAPVSGVDDPVLHEARSFPVGLDPIVSEFAHTPQMPVDARHALPPLEKRPGKPVIHGLELAHHQWKTQVLMAVRGAVARPRD